MLLLLNDGTVVEKGHAGLADGFLWLGFPGWTMQKAAEKAFDANAMNRIIWNVSEDDEEVYTGYTVCRHIDQDDGEIAVCMVKG